VLVPGPIIVEARPLSASEIFIGWQVCDVKSVVNTRPIFGTKTKIKTQMISFRFIKTKTKTISCQKRKRNKNKNDFINYE